MGVKIAQVTGVEALATWLNSNLPDFLGGVSKVGAQSIYQAADLDGNIVFKFTANDFTAYRRNLANPISTNGGSLYFSETSIIMCDNGIILDTSYTYNVSRKLGVLITKTNDSNVACIFSYGGTATANENYLYTQLRHVALGDDLTLSTTLTFTPESAGQTVLAPFTTDPEVGNVSYTPYAFYIPVSQSYSIGLGKFRLGSDTYITNGYWCIKT